MGLGDGNEGGVLWQMNDLMSVYDWEELSKQGYDDDYVCNYEWEGWLNANSVCNGNEESERRLMCE